METLNQALERYRQAQIADPNQPHQELIDIADDLICRLILAEEALKAVLPDTGHHIRDYAVRELALRAMNLDKPCPVPPRKFKPSRFKPIAGY